MLALEFPTVDNLVKWPAYFGDGTFYAFNKISLIGLLCVLIPTGIFLLARKEMVPSGLQNVVESTVNFVEKDIAVQAIGPEGTKYTPLLLSLFLFIFFGNLFEVIPTFHMPANARMAGPLFLALLVYFTWIAIGIAKHGPKYLWDLIYMPGLPKGLYLLTIPIEFLSIFIIRPFSHAVRLFANMLAGHILLVTFSVLTIALVGAGVWIVIAPLPFAMLVGLTAFEMMVAFLQAYVFALLSAVYIGGAVHVAH